MNNKSDIKKLADLLEKYYEATITRQEMLTLTAMLESESLPEQFYADRQLILPLHSAPLQNQEREKSRIESMALLQKAKRTSTMARLVRIACVSGAACVALIVVLLCIPPRGKQVKVNVSQVSKVVTPANSTTRLDTVSDRAFAYVETQETPIAKPTVLTVSKAVSESSLYTDRVARDTLNLKAFAERQNQIDEETVELVAGLFQAIEDDYRTAKILMDEIDDSFSFSSGLYIDNPESQTETPIISI